MSAWKRLWLGPILIALTTIAGLLAALLTDGFGDWFSICALGLVALFGIKLCVALGR